MNKSKIQVFMNDKFGKIRMVKIDNEPWFIAADVCKILSHSNPTVAMCSLEDFEKTKLDLGLSGGEINLISESEFYTLVLRSRKQIAKPFRLWVTCEVLPQIRQTGAYIPIDQNDSDEEIMAKGLFAAQRTIEKKNEIIRRQKLKLNELENNWKTLTDCTGTYSMNQIAHMIGVGEYTLFEYLRQMKILFKNEDNDNVPYEKPIHKDKFCVVPAIAPNGVIHSQTRIYPKGLKYIMMRLRKAGYLYQNIEVA